MTTRGFDVCRIDLTTIPLLHHEGLEQVYEQVVYVHKDHQRPTHMLRRPELHLFAATRNLLRVVDQIAAKDDDAQIDLGHFEPRTCASR